MEQKIVYYATKNIKNEAAQKIGEEISALKKKTLDNIYEKIGKNKTSELHKHLTWDDKIAGEKWRKEEVRQIMRTISYRIIEIVGNKEEIVFEGQRAFESIKKDDTDDGREREYIYVIEDIKNIDKRTKLFSEIQDMLDAAKNKMAHYNKLVNYQLDLTGKLLDEKKEKKGKILKN
jgi:hypothetical protein